MTVDERFFARGLLIDWDVAASSRDRDSMVLLLERVEVRDALQVANLILANPAKYGF